MRSLLLATIALLAGCRGENRSPSTMSESVDSSLPGPQRAAAAAARVTPLLQPALATQDLKIGLPVFLRAYKEEQELELWMEHPDTGKFVLFRRYPIAGASGTIGPKLAEGDRQVPEGFYYFSRSGMKPDSRYHLAFNIGYPNAYDRHHGRTGSFIMVHGNTASAGCLAMTDPKIEEIYTLCDAALDAGQPFIRIHLFPFRMTEQRMREVSQSRHFAFWSNLREGYQHFESHRRPPNTTLADGRYDFK